jgi:hypothetical protein
MSDEVVSGQDAMADAGSPAQVDEETAERCGDPNTQLTPQQTKLLTALVLDPDVQAAIVTTGVSRTTAYRWLGQPAFREELTRQRGDVLAEAMATVTTQAKRAATELMGLLTVKDERLRRLICNDILAHATKERELENIERRLDALERADKEREKRRTS